MTSACCSHTDSPYQKKRHKRNRKERKWGENCFTFQKTKINRRQSEVWFKKQRRHGRGFRGTGGGGYTKAKSVCWSSRSPSLPLFSPDRWAGVRREGERHRQTQRERGRELEAAERASVVKRGRGGSRTEHEGAAEFLFLRTKTTNR